MTARRRIADSSGTSHSAQVRRTPQLSPPEGLAAERFQLGSEEFLLLTFAAPAPERPHGTPRMQELTSSESTIACLALAGFSNSEIAEFRATSPGTIANQLTAVYRKLGLGSRRELQAYFSKLPRSSP